MGLSYRMFRRLTCAECMPKPRGGGAPNGRYGAPMRTKDNVSSSRSAVSRVAGGKLTLYCRQQRRDVAGDDLERVEESFADSPWQHQVQYFMHLTGQRGANRCGEHRQALEDGCFEGGAFLPATLACCVYVITHPL